MAARLWDTIYEVAEALGSLERIGTVRADAIYGIGPDIDLLIKHNLSFLVKGNSCFTAKRILRELDSSYDEWRRIDETTWAFDANYVPIRRCPYPVRTILTQAIDAKGKIEYRHIYTSFSPKEMDEVEVATSFRKRIDIETIIRDDKYGFHIDNLRAKNFNAKNITKTTATVNSPTPIPLSYPRCVLLNPMAINAACQMVGITTSHAKGSYGFGGETLPAKSRRKVPLHHDHSGHC